MPGSIYSKRYAHLPLPVIVYDTRSLMVIYANAEAALMFNREILQGCPLHAVFNLHQKKYRQLQSRFHNPSGVYFNLSIKTDAREKLSLSIAGCPLEQVNHEHPAILYLHKNVSRQHKPDTTAIQMQDFLSQITQNLYASFDTEIIINGILSMTGNFVGVDRTYIFEGKNGIFSNTYEWCSSKVTPQITNLQNVHVDPQTWNMIQNDFFISSDLSNLPPNSRSQLEPQGVKAVIILPLMAQSQAIGFIGFDECHRNRIWKYEEIQLLQILTGIIVQLLLRKQAQREKHEYQNIMQTVLDNVESSIYVSEFDTYKILFCNKSLRKILGKKDDEKLEGEICWKTLQVGQKGPCAFCPMPSAHTSSWELSAPCQWEFQNTINKRWYLIRDYVIQWIDKRYVHMEIATDITALKEKEANLQEFASKDRMTGIYNREWGHLMLWGAVEEIKKGRPAACLCFFDLDGLKKINDTYGHREGDTNIVRFVNVVKEFTRGSDIFCRWGGDEFLLLLSDCSRENTEKIIAKIKQKIDRINHEGKLPYPLAFSCGIQEIHQGQEGNVDQFITLADKRMYAHKATKPNSTRRHTNSP